MNMLSNEVLFYGGLVTASAALGLLLIFFIIFAIRGIKLNSDFNMEYGEKPKRGGKRS